MGLVDVRYSRDDLLVKRKRYNLAGITLVMPSMTVADGVTGFESHWTACKKNTSGSRGR
jgi:hypothetical protein